jgi:hypothetical protein
MMTSRTSILKLVLPLLIFISGCSGSKTSVASVPSKQASVSGDLYETIARMDSLLFTAFNNRDLEKLKTLFTDNLEFFHDIGGLTNYTQNMEAFKSTAAKNNDLRRELIAGSLEVYPVKDYGAMQIGSHRFCHTENGKPDCGVFKFVHIWKKTGDRWQISRVISYGH